MASDSEYRIGRRPKLATAKNNHIDSIPSRHYEEEEEEEVAAAEATPNLFTPTGQNELAIRYGALTLYEGGPVYSFALNSDIYRLTVECEAESLAINQLIETVDKRNLEVRKVTGILSKSHQMLVSEMNRLFLENSRMQKGDETPVSEDDLRPQEVSMEEFMRRKIEEQAHEDELHLEAKRNAKGLIKKLYKQVCQMCHPEKCKDKAMLDMFYVAKDLLTQNNVEGLQNLVNNLKAYVKLKQNKKGFREFLATRRKQNEEMRLKIERDLQEYSRSLPWRVVEAFQNGKLKDANELYVSLLNGEIQKLRLHNLSLKQMLRAQHDLKDSMSDMPTLRVIFRGL